MAATMATMNVVAASSAVAAAATPAVKASPSTVSLGSFRGQRLVAGRGVSVAARRSVVVRAEDKGVGKQIQDAGEDFSAAVQRGAESVKDNLQGTQADVSGKAKKAGSTAESKVKQGAGEADSAGSSIADKAEDLKDQLFGAGKGAQKETDKNVSKAKSGLSDAVDNVKDTFKGKN